MTQGDISHGRRVQYRQTYWLDIYIYKICDQDLNYRLVNSLYPTLNGMVTTNKQPRLQEKNIS